jgi:hypothetical protein
MAFVPVGRGLAELRGAVVERPLLPAGRLALAAVALRAAASRELRVTTGSFTGGGESISAGWLFWPDRDRRALSLDAPSPWGGVWSVEWVDMRQPFTDQLAPAERMVTRLGVAGWVDGRWRLGAAGGLERRHDQLDAVMTGSVLLRSEDDRLSLGTEIESWLGRRSSAVSSIRLAMSSSAVRRGMVVQAYAAAQVATSDVAPDLLPAGDTGHIRPTLLRAHPVLDGGALRIERLGRVMAAATLEGQQWWPVRGGLAAAAAAFVDVGRTARRRSGGAVDDVDVGVGARLVVPGVPGVLRVDVAKGLADGATAVSFVLQP